MEFVNKPFENHEPNKAWTDEVAGKDWGYQANLIENGRCRFLEPKNGLTPEELVLIYCYRYMQSHTVSGFHMYCRNLEEQKIKLFPNPVFVDFGCGPMTCGVSLAWYYLVNNPELAKTQGVLCRYIGIDQSPVMLAHAHSASMFPGLFHEKSTFQFITPKEASDKLPASLAVHRSKNMGNPLKVILNCSYFFGSPTLDAPSLVRFIRQLITKHLANDRVCLTYQNADFGPANDKWITFRDGVKDLLPSVSSKTQEINYFDITGRKTQHNPQSIKRRRGSLLNHSWQKHLKG